MPAADRAPSLNGRRVVLLESRRAVELADLVRRYGGEPWSVPAMRETKPDDQTETVARLREVCDRGADVVVLLTGVGTRAMFELAGQLGLEHRLRAVLDAALVVVRGPKPQAALRQLGIRIDRSAAEPHTSREVLDALVEDSFRSAAIQLYGQPDPELRHGLEQRGVSVLELPLYRWRLPEDVAGLLDLVDNLDRADAVAITSAGQIHNLVAVAETHGRGHQLRESLSRLVIVAVGPVAARALAEQGFQVRVQPQHPHMGPMIRDLAAYFSAVKPE